jgi:hypothetical protein
VQLMHELLASCRFPACKHVCLLCDYVRQNWCLDHAWSHLVQILQHLGFDGRLNI